MFIYFKNVKRKVMKLVIVESPTKSKTIAHYLGEGYEVEASKGHVKDLATSGKGGLGIDVDNNFEAHYVINDDKKELVNKLKKIAKKADEVILATDPDREGEAIAFSLAKVLDLPVETTKRLEFHEITKNSILSAIESPRTIDMNLVHSQETRRIIDRIMGFKLSNLLQNKIKSQSAGRVQSVALKIICDHEKEILNFKSEKFYKIPLKISINDKEYELTLYSFNDEKIENFSDKETATKAFNSLFKEAIVKNIEKKEKEVASKEPFRTSTLQQAAFSKYGFSTKETTFLAQELYEGIETEEGLTGLITYIRTDSTKLADTFVSSAKNYIISTFGKEYYKGVTKGKDVKNSQDAHEAIRPTDVNNTPEKMKKYLSAKAYKLYKLIYERTLSSLMSHKKVEVSTIYFECGDKLIYKLTSTKTLFDGYDKFKDDDKVLDLSKELNLDNLISSKYKIVDASLEEDETKPPSRYSEGKMVKIMEEKGIGRPSTYSSTIQTLIQRKYVTSTKGTLTPTEQGILTSSVLDKYFPELINTEYTAEMENNLDKIQNGEEDEVKVISDFYYPFIEKFNEVKEIMYKEPPKTTGEKCPNCGADLVIKRGRYGEFVACSNYPSCKYIQKKEKEAPVMVGRNCPLCNSPLVYRKNKKGDTFIGCSNFPKCRYVEGSEEKKEETKFCPKCGNQLVRRRGKRGYFYGCSSYPKCDYIEPIK